MAAATASNTRSPHEFLCVPVRRTLCAGSRRFRSRELRPHCGRCAQKRGRVTAAPAKLPHSRAISQRTERDRHGACAASTGRSIARPRTHGTSAARGTGSRHSLQVPCSAPVVRRPVQHSAALARSGEKFPVKFPAIGNRTRGIVQPGAPHTPDSHPEDRPGHRARVAARPPAAFDLMEEIGQGAVE